MQLSYNGKKFLEEREGFRSKAYLDTAGVWTIGYGTTYVDGRKVEPGMTCTQEQADIWLQQDTALVQTAINKFVKIPLRQNQFDALVSFIYNEGIAAFSGSTMLKMINAGSFITAANEFPKWDKEHVHGILQPNPGLHARRLLEQALFAQK